MSLKAIEFVSAGCRELWLLKGEGWCLPMFADPVADPQDKKFYFCQLTLMPNKAQHEAFVEKTRERNIANDGSCVIEANHLPLIAERATGILPDYYLQWDGARPKDEVKYWINDEAIQCDESKDMEAFLRYVHKNAQPGDFGAMRIFWVAFLAMAEKWLLEENRPLDLGFCRIHALPYRVNWKDFLDNWHKRSPEMFNQPRAQRLNDLAESGFIADLFNTRLAAMDKYRNFFYWTLEIEPGRKWTSHVQTLELARRTAYGNNRYALYFKKMAERLQDSSLAVYGSWIKERTRPTGKVVERSWRGFLALLPESNPSRMRPDHEKCTKRASKLPDSVEYRDPGDVSQTPPPLPEVPPVQSETTYVRFSGGEDG